MPHEVLFLFDFLNFDSTCMHILLMKVTRMRLKSDFLAEVFVLWSMGNEFVPSPLKIYSSGLPLNILFEIP